jgi:hypothetical protein
VPAAVSTAGRESQEPLTGTQNGLGKGREKKTLISVVRVPNEAASIAALPDESEIYMARHELRPTGRPVALGLAAALALASVALSGCASSASSNWAQTAPRIQQTAPAVSAMPIGSWTASTATAKPTAAPVLH